MAKQRARQPVVSPGDLPDLWTIIDGLRDDARAFAESVESLAATLGPRRESVVAESIAPPSVDVPAAAPRVGRGSGLSPEVRAVLERAAFADGVLKLPGEQLDRKPYVAVNAALEALGGKWNRKVGGHVFARDAADALAAMLATGIVPPKNPDAFFATPRPLADRMVARCGGSLLNMAHVRILEPSAGIGGIVDAVRDVAPLAMLDLVESSPERAADLRSRFGPSDVLECDFLTFAPEYRYDAIVMNPPFAVERDANEYIPHIIHAHALLSPGGLLVAVAPSGLLTRDDRRPRELRELIASVGGRIESLDAESFASSGTSVNTVLVTMRASA